MARHTALARAPIVIAMPKRRGGRIRRAGRRAVGFARRARASRHAPSLSIVGILLGGAAAGWAEHKGYLKRLPQIGGSAALSLAAVGYIAHKYVKNRAVKTAGIAVMAAAAFDFGRVQAGGTSGLDELDELDERHL